MSHPSWVCGLKLVMDIVFVVLLSHTLRGCVDWNYLGYWLWWRVFVTPFVGVWIETSIPMSWHKIWNVTPFVGVWIETCLHPGDFSAYILSHPSWVCGLKLISLECLTSFHKVTPFVGVWIETRTSVFIGGDDKSHTLRGCVDWNIALVLSVLCLPSHTLRGCVDWNRILRLLV